ncbi:MAG: HNH endonuclease signature motif containing protein [Bacillota bacterium]
MGKIAINCSWCGNKVFRYPSAIRKHVFCSSDCRRKYLSKEHNPDGYIKHPHLSNFNEKTNPTRMTNEVKRKLREARLNSGEGKTYTKTYGRHTHRIVAEQMLGRSLLLGEVVHHIDGNKRNNKPENLMVFASQEEHAAWHVREEKFFHGTVLGQEVMPK